MVNESGASVYSASEAARAEFPDLDVTVRGAISIARRLQDPLAELVKIDPKSLGVGQYQHDVNQTALRKALDREVIESCVNTVGRRPEHRERQAAIATWPGSAHGSPTPSSPTGTRTGRSSSRADLLGVPRLGDRAFEQSAGFLRVRAGRSRSTTRPSTRRATRSSRRWPGRRGRPSSGSSGTRRSCASSIRSGSSTSEAGLPTIRDILAELEKPGRDPRKEFRVAEVRRGGERDRRT